LVKLRFYSSRTSPLSSEKTGSPLPKGLFQPKLNLAMDLDSIVVRLHPEVPFPIIELPLDAGEITVGKTFGLNIEEWIP